MAHRDVVAGIAAGTAGATAPGTAAIGTGKVVAAASMKRADAAVVGSI